MIEKPEIVKLETECDDIKDINSKDRCFIELAKEKDNTEYCKGIEEMNLKIGCYLAPWQESECKYKEYLGEECE